MTGYTGIWCGPQQKGSRRSFRLAVRAVRMTAREAGVARLRSLFVDRKLLVSRPCGTVRKSFQSSTLSSMIDPRCVRIAGGEPFDEAATSLPTEPIPGSRGARVTALTESARAPASRGRSGLFERETERAQNRRARSTASAEEPLRTVPGYREAVSH